MAYTLSDLQTLNPNHITDADYERKLKEYANQRNADLEEFIFQLMKKLEPILKVVEIHIQKEFTNPRFDYGDDLTYEFNQAGQPILTLLHLKEIFDQCEKRKKL